MHDDTDMKQRLQWMLEQAERGELKNFLAIKAARLDSPIRESITEMFSGLHELAADERLREFIEEVLALLAEADALHAFTQAGEVHELERVFEL